jgi:hypothetical protein
VPFAGETADKLGKDAVLSHPYWMLSNLSSKTLFGHFCKLRLMSLMGHILDLLDLPDEALVKRVQLQL